MSRMSTDELAGDGSIRNGFDYQLQVWVRDGIIQKDGHVARLGHCKACTFAGVPVIAVPGHEIRKEGPAPTRADHCTHPTQSWCDCDWCRLNRHWTK